MTIEGQEVSAVQQTEHPYIVRVAGVCSGRPIIKSTRISVRSCPCLLPLTGATVSQKENLECH